MKKNILMRTNILVCLVIIIGFTTTAVLSYQANYTASVQNIEQVSALTSEGIYYQLTSIFTKPVNISLTMANDSLLKGFLADEKRSLTTRFILKRFGNTLTHTGPNINMIPFFGFGSNQSVL